MTTYCPFWTRDAFSTRSFCAVAPADALSFVPGLYRKCPANMPQPDDLGPPWLAAVVASNASPPEMKHSE